MVKVVELGLYLKVKLIQECIFVANSISMKNRLTPFLLFAVILLTSQYSLLAGPGDTIKVTTFTFGSVQDDWFELPSLDIEVEKILMKYTLKCNPAQSPACGEWDYLTYTYLYDHTGELDSNLLTHPNYTIDGGSPESYSYNTSPVYTYMPYWLYSIDIEDTISFESYTIGTGTDEFNAPLMTSEGSARSQFIYTAEELLAAGLTAGDISGVRLKITTPGSTVPELKIRMAHSSETEFVDNLVDEDWVTVFHNNIYPAFTGWAPISFTNTFEWDGVSSIIVDVSFDSESGLDDTWLESEDIGVERTAYIGGAEAYLNVADPSYAAVVGTEAAASLENEITVAYWSYGDPEFQPQSGTTFELRDAVGNRAVNVHGPWGDGVIYWDAGNDGGGSYDRISKAAAASDYEGRWTHWAFTKNAVSGEMKIYKDGVEWHSGSGKTRSMSGAEIMRIGKGHWGGSQSYYGKVDEFAIWTAELDEATIQEYMYKDLDGSHPNTDDLVLYYQFNQASEIMQSDLSASDNELLLLGAQSTRYSSDELFRNVTVSTMRPNVIWEQGVYTSTIDSVLYIDTIEVAPSTLVLFDPENPTVGLDTIQVWAGDFYTYTYDANGDVADSSFVGSEATILYEDYEYYSEPFEVIDRYELARYITPYGIGLDLGDGFTWTFDLSDYRPLLHDSVRIAAGNWQELLQMELWFIEGTPPREPLSVTNLWTGYKGYNTDEAFDENTPPVEIDIPANAANSRVKVRVTGHGFGGTLNCAEFCAKDHYFKVDGETVWTQEVWRDDCDVNPVYPQGGTWVYDRANWCPGAEVGTYNFELTPFVNSGETYTFDYAAQDYTWNGSGSFPYYQTEVQLITYDEPNFTLDAGLVEIVAPSTNQMWERKNPICNNPIIRIQNTGTTELTSLMVEYGMKDTEKSYYLWTGNLAFMETEEVVLSDYIFNVTDEFEVSISEPNGGVDEYSLNNQLKSSVVLPPTYPSSIILDFKTNTKPNENDIFIYNSNGEEVFARTSFEASTVHKDTIELTDGCYELYLWDYDEDGIAWWANSDGTGYFRIRDGIEGTIMKNFEPDFGGLIYLQFVVGTYLDVEELPAYDDESLKVFPNPAAETVFVQADFNSNEPAQLTMYDFSGKEVYRQTISALGEMTQIDVSDFPSGMYFISVNNGESRFQKTVVIE